MRCVKRVFYGGVPFTRGVGLGWAVTGEGMSIDAET